MPQTSLTLRPRSTSSTAIPKTYAQLLARVRQILEQGRTRAKTALEQEEVRTWWKMARVINEHLRIHDGRAGYGEKVVGDLAAELKITPTYLYDILRFQKAFNILNPGLKLTLSHYRDLARIEDATERKRLTHECLKKKWNVPELRREIQAHKGLKMLSPPQSLGGDPKTGFPTKPFGNDSAVRSPSRDRVHSPLLPRRGEFYTYRIRERGSLHTGEDLFSLDLGFKAKYDLKLPGITKPKPGDIVQTVRTKKNRAGDQFRFAKSKAGKDALYTYKAQVLKVYDADSPQVDIDLGFRIWHDERLRLRGIDAKEISKGGETARDYVRERLSKVPFVVISVVFTDKFDRPLADLFYLEGTDDPEKVLHEGRFLNQELLDRGLAVRYG